MKTIGKFVSEWGEGPLWHQGRFYYVDIEGHKVICLNPGTEEEQVWKVGERVGTVVPRASGGLVIAGDSGFRILNTTDGSITSIVDPEAHLPNNRFNEGKCDPSGRFWAGTMHLEKPRQATGALYRLDADHSVHKLVDGITVSNGIVWTSDRKTMYYIDTPTLHVDAFDYDDRTGTISNRRAVIDTTGLEGVPDGMAIDVNNRLWVAMCHGRQVICFDPLSEEPSKPVHTLPVPVKEPTAVAFGGPELKDLYITTGLSNEEHPDDGRLFVTNVDVAGQPSFSFAG